MHPNALPTLSFVRAALHRTLRAWQNAPRRPQSLFNALLYFRAPATAFGQPSVELLEENFTHLEAIIHQAAVLPRHAEVLQRRFKHGDSTQQIAFDWHCSPDQVNRLQREAIHNLAVWLHSQEEALRQREYSRRLAGLPASSYSLLVGRQPQVDQLVRLLKQPDGPGVVAVTGLGGLGKTALADAAVRQLIADWAFEDVIWLRIHGDEEKTNWQAIQERLAQQVLPGYLPGSHLGAELLQCLKQHPHLVILDNLEAEAAQDWVGELQALCHPSKFLLTHRRLPTALHDVRVIQLEELSQTQAEEFLRNHIQRLGLEGDTPDAQPPLADILAYTGGNPLALKLVAGLLHSLSLTSVLAALRNASSERTEALFKTIYETAWQTLSPAARNLLLTFVLVGEEGASPAHLEAVDGLSERQRHDALQQLTGLSLLELRGATQEPRYGVHRLTQTFLLAYLRNTPQRNKLQQKRRAANLRFWCRTLKADPAYAIEEGNLARALESGLSSPALWADSVDLLGKLFPHVRSKAAAMRWIEFYQQASQAQPTQTGRLARLHNQLGALAWLVEDYRGAADSFRQAQKLATTPGHRQTALVGICLCHWAQGEHSQAAQQARAAQGLAPADPRLRALQGLVSYSRGHFRAAEKHFTRALSLLGRIQTPLQVQLRIQRGLCQQMAGQLHQALKHYGLAMDTLQSTPGSQRECAHLELLRSAAFFQLADRDNGNACLQRALRYAPVVEETSSQAYFVSSLGRLVLPALPRPQGRSRALRIKSKPEMVLNPLGLLRMEDFE